MDICDRLILGNSPPIQRLKELLRQVADSDLNTALYGETGVGKELAAQALHLSSYRRKWCQVLTCDIVLCIVYGLWEGR